MGQRKPSTVDGCLVIFMVDNGLDTFLEHFRLLDIKERERELV